MTTLIELDAYIYETLRIGDVPKDYSNNGLQVEGNTIIKKAIFSVDASVELFDKAVEENADFIFVHHGISWGDNLKRITKQNALRLRPLIKNDISLYGVHLPLDAHPVYGHNAQLANFIGLENQQLFSPYSGVNIGVYGELAEESTPKAIAEIFDLKLDSEHKIFGDSERKIKTVGIISGAGASGIEDAVELGLDCFITGEIKHEVFHTIKELDIPVITLGHYCSEKPGVWAMMELLSEKFNLDCTFIDIPTGL